MPKVRRIIYKLWLSIFSVSFLLTVVAALEFFVIFHDEQAQTETKTCVDNWIADLKPWEKYQNTLKFDDGTYDKESILVPEAIKEKCGLTYPEHFLPAYSMRKGVGLPYSKNIWVTNEPNKWSMGWLVWFFPVLSILLYVAKAWVSWLAKD